MHKHTSVTCLLWRLPSYMTDAYLTDWFNSCRAFSSLAQLKTSFPCWIHPTIRLGGVSLRVPGHGRPIWCSPGDFWEWPPNRKWRSMHWAWLPAVGSGNVMCKCLGCRRHDVQSCVMTVWLEGMAVPWGAGYSHCVCARLRQVECLPGPLLVTDPSQDSFGWCQLPVSTLPSITKCTHASFLLNTGSWRPFGRLFPSLRKDSQPLS